MGTLGSEFSLADLPRRVFSNSESASSRVNRAFCSRDHLFSLAASVSVPPYWRRQLCIVAAETPEQRLSAHRWTDRLGYPSFCGDCDRVRLTADGMLRNCLFANDETDLRPLLCQQGRGSEFADEAIADAEAYRAVRGVPLSDATVGGDSSARIGHP
ncbi:hypothetical protein [Nocardia rhamnosiphila]|uniref:hypothetical protein n=1 Tax=Nocardia rhamnosiphila TaxID=426716 RepID=UPI003F4CC96A